MSGKLDPDEMLAIMIAGARLNPERSHALPASNYGDPSKVIRLSGEMERKSKEKLLKINKKWR